jgi:tRNA (guanine37-N1)-methyltransferase
VTAFEVVTIFPEAIRSFVAAGLLGKAIERGVVEVHATDPRDFTDDKHRSVDDAPFGGGAGMVMKAEPIVLALEALEAARGPTHRILLTPAAPRFDQAAAARLAALPRVALVCGRYEGVDDRVREHFVHECLSLGDFVLGGGEVAALAIIEATSRLVAGVLGNPASAIVESFAADDRGALLEHPQYTRPAELRGHAVPDVLLGGDHGAIERWRADAARRRTWAIRPDLRAVDPLPASVAIHIAIPLGVPIDAGALGEVARAHGVAGIALVGATPEQVARLAKDSGGRTPVAAFADLRALVRRLRQRGGDPRVVALVDPASAAVGSTTSAREVLDTLGPLAGGTLVLALGEAPLADAHYAQEPAEARSPALAPGAAIVDASRPGTGPAAAIDRAIRLLRAGADQVTP